VEIRVSEDPAAAAGTWLAEQIREAVRRRGEALVAVSGGSTAPPMFRALLDHDVPWERTTIWQVDERVAPDGDPARNAGQLVPLPCQIRLMPVADTDLVAGARRYGAGLPERFDVVHLGLGSDGHTASWPPGDRVVDSEQPCETTGEFNGFARMTLTPPVVNAARCRLMLTLGASKAPMVARWLLHDPSIPADRVRRDDTWLFLDPAAAEDLPSPGDPVATA
jgi:6-phosphogluconolactonase/glucosamine-6-phosphate isomerase/deaminase